MFDKAHIIVKAGAGGNGSISFRHEKFVPYGGPDGGDGGHGGDVLVVADSSITDLRRFNENRLFKSDRGENGQGNKKHGKKGKDLLLMVPPGTIISGKEGDDIITLADLEGGGQRVIVARGGRGGRGNTHFKSSTNQVPRVAEKGEEGEAREIILEMRLIADIGIIGYPNVGKSSLLSAASKARPKIASYPFTTLEPVLGVVEAGENSFVIAEIPGLIEGAHVGRGLGHEFLRHAMRTKMFIHLIDGSSLSPVEDMLKVNEELSLFDVILVQKPQLVAVNKVDLPEVEVRVPELKRSFAEAGVDVIFVSATTRGGVPELMSRAARMLADISSRKEEVTLKVFKPEPKDRQITIIKEGDVFVITAPGLDRLISRDKGVSPEMRLLLERRLTRLGASKVLKKAGVKPGDKVRIGELEWEW